MIRLPTGKTQIALLPAPPAVAADAPVAVPAQPAPAAVALRDRLRSRTRAAHLAAEAALDPTNRLGSVRGYAETLALFESFHAACDLATAPLQAILPAALRVGADRRRERLDRDLRRLGAGRGPSLPAPTLTTVDHQLGAWYVIEGSALGGLVIAAEVHRRLPAVAEATTYFTGEGRATAARWRAFGELLTCWEIRGDAAAERAVQGALETFATLTGELDRRAAA